MRISSASQLIIIVVCFAFLFLFIGASFDVENLTRLPVWSIAMFLFFLALNAFAAIFRLKITASDLSQKLTFNQATLAFSGGVFGGALFFQLPGQIIARSAFLATHGVSTASVVVITGYERAFSAITSLLFAVAGAYVLFGRVVFDGQSGGFLLLKVVIGLVVVSTTAAALGYPQFFSTLAEKLLKWKFLVSAIKSLALNVFVQVPMMLAYLVLFKELNPSTSTIELLAGISIVMLAASVPISFAGWGVREVSAVFVMGVIGVPAGLALTAAASVGLGALLVTVLIAMAGLAWRRYAAATEAPQLHQAPSTGSLDLGRSLLICVTLASATLIPFQIFVPTQSGLINVNLADPLALLAGGLLIATSLQTLSVPSWQHRATNYLIVVATIAMIMALLIGASRFGWTTWATTNRLFGWFILIGYLIAGGMIIRVLGNDGRVTAARTVCAAILGVAALELALVIINQVGFRLPDGMLVYPIAGFSQNRNAFALQLLIGASLCLAFVPSSRLRVGMLGVYGAAVILAGSRAGWGSAVILLAAAMIVRVIDWRQTAVVTTLAFALFGAIVALPSVLPLLALPSEPQTNAAWLTISILPNASTTEERWYSLIGGFELFQQHPWFGAGLGAFMNQELVANGRPLVIHSTPIWLLAEFGLVGSAVFFIGLTLLAIASLRLAKSSAQEDKALLLVLICVGVMAAVHDMMYQRLAWFVVGMFLVTGGSQEKHSDRL